MDVLAKREQTGNEQSIFHSRKGFFFCPCIGLEITNVGINVGKGS